MTTLYIDRKDIELRVAGGALEFHGPNGKRGSAPLASLERVVLRGRVRLTTSVLGAIAESGAGMLTMSGRQNRHLATCVGRPHNDVVRQLGQFDAYRDRVLVAESFSRDNGAVLLGKAGRRRFYERFNPLCAALRRILRRQLSTAAREFSGRGAEVQVHRSVGESP